MIRSLLLALICVCAGACGADAPSSTSNSDADGDPAHDADTTGDVVADTDESDVLDAAQDAMSDADTALDAVAEVVDDVARDAPADDADTAPQPLFVCPSLPGPTPSWIEPRGDTSVVTCDGYRVYVEGNSLHARLQFVPAGRASVERSWARSELYPLDEISWELLDDDTAVSCSQQWQLTVDRDTCAMALHHLGTPALWRFDGDLSTDGEGVRMSFPTAADQRWFGCGENTGPHDRRGTRMTYWSTDAYDSEWGGYAPGADPLYLSVPFCTMQSAAGYLGLFVDHPWRMTFDVGASEPDVFGIAGAGPTLSLVLMTSSDPQGPGYAYADVTGLPIMPPRWALGFHQSRWGYADAATFEAIAAGFRDRAMPADALWFDIQHMDGFRTFTWDPVAFPDPAGLLGSLERQGFRAVAIADPGIKVDDGWALYRDARDAGVFLRWPDGRDFVGYAWPGEASWPDVSSRHGYAFWRDHVADMARLGIDGVWIDVNEPTTFPEGGGGNTIPDEVVADGEGTSTTMAELHNVYALLQARATYEGLLQGSPGRHRPFVLSRAGYAGIQRWAGIWTGDVPSTWHGLRETLPMMLNIGVSGIPLVGSDVGGYSGGASPELYARWFELGFLSPFFRAHVTSGVEGQEPWQFGTEVTDIARYWLEQRSRYMPYFYSLAWEAHTQGTPMLRPLWYELPGDPELAGVDDQAMLGPWLLAAPVLEEGATRRTIRLPAGRWFELRSDAAYDGPVELDRVMTLAALPLYVREGAILPSREPMQYETPLMAPVLNLDVWPAEHETRFTVFDDDGTSLTYNNRSGVLFATSRDRLGVTVEQRDRGDDATMNWSSVEVRVHRVERRPGLVLYQSAGTVTSPLTRFESLASLRQGGEGWYYSATERRLYARLPQSRDWTLTVNYSPTLIQLRPAQRIDFEVTVPDDTPVGATIYFAGDVTDWEHVPLGEVGDDGIARGTIEVPAGEWYFFKFTRGSWETVEKYPDCEEARDRYAPGAAGLRRETVWAWRDVCEGG